MKYEPSAPGRRGEKQKANEPWQIFCLEWLGPADMRFDRLSADEKIRIQQQFPFKFFVL